MSYADTRFIFFCMFLIPDKQQRMSYADYYNLLNLRIIIYDKQQRMSYADLTAMPKVSPHLNG